MPNRQKGTSKKIYIAIFLLVVLVVAAFALIYYTQEAASVINVVPGVHVGDTFSYSLQGICQLIGLDAVQPPGFSEYNATDQYKITITAVNGTSVSLDSEWKFTNGTIISDTQTIDLSNGAQTNQNGFWAIYSSNLNQNNPLRPKGYDRLIVNSTDTKQYADSARVRNFWSIDNSFFDTTDPTQSTWRLEHTSVYFDKQTGMLDTLTDIQEYNNPQMRLVVIWKLASTSVWSV